MSYNEMLSEMAIYSRRDGHPYKVSGFREYSIDIDLETDSDQFHLILENPHGVYSGIFNKYDATSLYVFGKEVMHGRVDEVNYIGDSTQNIIEIVGRDDFSILIDNDAVPGTMKNVDPVDYLKKKCVEYSLTTDVVSGQVVPRVYTYGDISLVDTVVIGTGESEMTVLNNMVADTKTRLWQDNDHLCIGDWQTSKPAEFLFTRGTSSDEKSIPIEKISVKDSGVGIKSQVLVYGTSNDGKEKVLGTANNPLKTFYDGIPRRQIIMSYNNDKNTKYSGSAERKIRDAFRNGIEVEVTVNPQRMTVPVWINKTARVVDKITGLDATMFIKAVNYTKSVDSGSACTIKMIPDDVTFNILWTNIGPTSKGKDNGYIIIKKK